MKTIILFIGIFLLASCGKSPLLNKAKDSPFSVVTSQEKKYEFPKAQLKFQMTWITPPNIEELSSLNLEFEDAIASEIAIESYIEMRDHGHGSSPIVITILKDQKTVELKELSFFMTGRWTLVINLIKNGKQIDTWEKDIYL